MVIIGFYFILMFAIVWYVEHKKMEAAKVASIHYLVEYTAAYLAGQLGWIVAGSRTPAMNNTGRFAGSGSRIGCHRQWLPPSFCCYLIYTALIAEVTIMVKQIKKGPEI